MEKESVEANPFLTFDTFIQGIHPTHFMYFLGEKVNVQITI